MFNFNLEVNFYTYDVCKFVLKLVFIRLCTLKTSFVIKIILIFIYIIYNINKFYNIQIHNKFLLRILIAFLKFDYYKLLKIVSKLVSVNIYFLRLILILKVIIEFVKLSNHEMSSFFCLDIIFFIFKNNQKCLIKLIIFIKQSFRFFFFKNW